MLCKKGLSACYFSYIDAIKCHPLAAAGEQWFYVCNSCPLKPQLKVSTVFEIRDIDLF